MTTTTTTWSTQEQVIQDQILTHFHFKKCKASNRDENGEHTAMHLIDFSDMHQYEQVQVNSVKVVNFIVLDIDHRNWETVVTKLEDIPAWVKPTPSGAHIGIMVDGVHRYAKGSWFFTSKAFKWMEALRANLTLVADADTSYSNYSTRNPFYHPETTLWLNSKVWRLQELEDRLKELDVFMSGLGFVLKNGSKHSVAKDHRNSRIYWATMAAKQRDNTLDTQKFADAQNSMFEYSPKGMLSASEIAGIVRSVENNYRRVRCNDEGKLAEAVEQGQRGGLANSDSQKEQRAKQKRIRESRVKYALDFKAQGYSVEEISEVLGVSVSTVYSYLSKGSATLSLPVLGLENVTPTKKEMAVHLKEKGLTAQAIADEIGVSKRTVQRYLSQATEAAVEHVQTEEVPEVQETVTEAQKPVQRRSSGPSRKRKSTRKHWDVRFDNVASVRLRSQAEKTDDMIEKEFILALIGT